MSAAPPFPLSALVGQASLVEALLACAIDPRIGGVLVRGERGTAKSTAVRALAPLLPDGGTLVELPIGATADRLLGSLDLDRALTAGEAAFSPGLLAAADGGVLYVDEVNLLPDHLVDVLLDAAAMGVVHVEREGVSASYDARFVLVGTMNPEEGDLRPQLLDRFGLGVEVAGTSDPAERGDVVRRRLAYDADPAAFADRYAADESALAERLAAARTLLPSVRLPDRVLSLITSTCARLGVDGLRADIVCARAASALAALDGVDEVSAEHVRRAAMLALAHRRRRGPLEAPGLSEDELSSAMDGDQPEPEPPGGGGSPGQAPQGEGADAGAPSPSGPSNAPSPGGVCSEPGDGCLPGHTSDSVPAPQPVAPPSAPGRAPLLALAGKGAGAAGRRSQASSVDGAPIDSVVPDGPVRDLSVAATLRAAAARGGGPVQAADLREHLRAGREGNLVVFCVDASGSMGARRRMAAVKGAVLGLLLDAYQRRDRVALVTFRGDAADVVLPPTSSVERAAAVLADVATGGRTPLAAGLTRTADLIAAEARRDADRRALAVVVTDGRAKDRSAARDAAARLARTAQGVVVFDAEEGGVRLGLAGELARAAGARLLPLSALAPDTTVPPTAARRTAA